MPKLSVRDQVLGFMQQASFFCERYSKLKVTVQGPLGEELGDVVASIQDLKSSVAERIPLNDFLGRLVRNTLRDPD